MADRPLLKDLIYDRAAVERIAARLAPNLPGFDAPAFVEEVAAALPPLALMERMEAITAAIAARLPADFPKAVAILLASLPPDTGRSGVEGTAGFDVLPFIHHVGIAGIEDFATSMDALEEMTRRFSAEGDVRRFIRRYPAPALARLRAWAASPDPRVRRLASEGSRPRLPWAERLPAFIADPEPVLSILELLMDDPDPVVRRSVANNLNDIAKDHADRVAAFCARWRDGAGPGTRGIIRHGLRTLIKRGHPGALALVGATTGAAAVVEQLALAAGRVILGGALEFSFTLGSASGEPAVLVVDYAIHHRKANGALSPKVFKLTRRELGPGESVRISKRHPIRPITTRRYHGGGHRLEILVNGRSAATADFELVVVQGGR
jgi:3-methyladenine DNA glycosylase AlkC